MLLRTVRPMHALPALAVLLALGLVLVMARPARAQDAPPTAPLTATVVVESEAGVVGRMITFTTPVSGLAALQASGLAVTLAETSFGAAVCAIEGSGCPADNCFCDSERFWNYGFWNGTAWEGYAVGATDTRIEAGGALELWRWGTFTGTVSAEPAAVWAALDALDWLQDKQSRRTGGYGNMGASAETMIAIGANGTAARDWRIDRGLADLERYARSHQTRFARGDVASAGKLAVALTAAGACWNGRALLPMDYYDADAGAFSSDSGFNAWGILGTAALGEPVPEDAVAALRQSAIAAAPGGWEWQAGFGADSNTTALALQALVAAGEPVTATAVLSGLAYLRAAQQPDGGFAYDASGTSGSDANSTAYAIMALRAVGEDPTGAEWSVGGVSPVDFLLGLRQPDGGFAWQPGMESNAFATQQAIPALLARSLPVAARPLEPCPAP